MLVSMCECLDAGVCFCVCQSVDDICHYAYVIKWRPVVVAQAGVGVLAELAEMRVCLFLAATKLAAPQRPGARKHIGGRQTRVNINNI